MIEGDIEVFVGEAVSIWVIGWDEEDVGDLRKKG